MNNLQDKNTWTDEMLGSSKEPNSLDYKKVRVYYRCPETDHNIDENNIGKWWVLTKSKKIKHSSKISMNQKLSKHMPCYVTYLKYLSRYTI